MELSFQKYVKSIRLRPCDPETILRELFQKYVKSIRLRPIGNAKCYEL